MQRRHLPRSAQPVSAWHEPFPSLASGLESGPRGMGINVDGGTKPNYGRRNELDKPGK